MADDPKPKKPLWAWWFPLYVHAIFFIARWTGWRPSKQQLERAITRAFKQRGRDA